MNTEHQERRSDDRWHLDRRVPIALIIAITAQFFTAVWWASGMDSRVSTLEQLAVNNASVESRLARMEESQSWIKKILERIEAKLGTDGR